MAGISRLHRRQNSGMYHCRVAVPHDVRAALGKRELHISLKTSDLTLAKQRLLLESVKIDQRFAAIRGLPVTELVLPELNGNASTIGKGSITLIELVEKYFAATEQRNLAVKTKLEYGIRFRVIKEFFGEYTPIASITRDDCRQFQQTVMLVPPNASKRFPKMGLKEVVEHAKRHRLAPMAPKTVNQHISCLNLLMEWACRERLLDANPARGLFVEDAVKLKDKRDPFTSEQLNNLFNSDVMRSYREANSARFWIPLLALWTGARLNELCQLRVTDITTHDGIHGVAIYEADGKRLKTVNANRIIPIHPQLIELGFIDYVSKVIPPKSSGSFE